MKLSPKGNLRFICECIWVKHLCGCYGTVLGGSLLQQLPWVSKFSIVFFFFLYFCFDFRREFWKLFSRDREKMDTFLFWTFAALIMMFLLALAMEGQERIIKRIVCTLDQLIEWEVV